MDHLSRTEGPYVIKADGLAAGKGVLVTESRTDAESWVGYCLEGGFGDAGASVMIEEYLDGPEVSVFAVCTESGAVPLEPARDYKRLFDDDEGPNTGGMGSYSPVDDLPRDLVTNVMTDVIDPVIEQMRVDGNPFTGFLYAGLVLTDSGPKVLEFNVRLGDPECQAILPRMTSDLVDVLEGASPEWSAMATVNVVLASVGYPTAPEKGAVIKGLDRVPEEVIVFHAGTKRDGRKLLVSGGRVLNLVGTGATVGEARAKAYAAAETVAWRGAQYRTDIADGYRLPR